MYNFFLEYWKLSKQNYLKHLSFSFISLYNTSVIFWYHIELIFYLIVFLFTLSSNKKWLPRGGIEPPDLAQKFNVLTTTPRQLLYITDKIFLRNQFDKPHEVPVLHQKFQISNFQIWITFPRSGCSRYLKACSRPTLWLLSSHFGRMLEHPLRGKDIKHQCSIYY